MKSLYQNWTGYTSIVVFATYWLSNLLLWYPWSYNATLGMTLMFVAITPIWTYAVFHTLQRYPGDQIIKGATWTALIFGLITIVLDFIFYGLIRQAMTELYHPTTLFGYAFLVALPFILSMIARNKVQQTRGISAKEFAFFTVMGSVSLLAIFLIVVFNITLSKHTFKFITMMLVSAIIFNVVLLIVLSVNQYKPRLGLIAVLTILCVVIGMLMGKYGAILQLPWWIYYPVPLLMSILLPPILLKMAKRQTIVYLIMSFLSAPLIHTVFSFFFGWTEYMPFWNIPYFKTLFG